MHTRFRCRPGRPIRCQRPRLHSGRTINERREMSSKGAQHSVPTTASSYEPKPIVDSLVWDKDVMAPMRDGVKLCVDVYRPGASGKFPALLAIAGHNKDLQSPDVAKAVPPQP